ncbi:UNVERIFIED_CONTAM: hypothetical protein Slati_3192000 [Sesamum latifolium]|uniref:Uncharacterized protein n=1 Tax=Sesamum latifolium TaxID=2727402 RepID=A0AAW2V2N0_9LAMI
MSVEQLAPRKNNGGNTSAHHFLLLSSHHLRKQAISITAKASSSSSSSSSPYEKKDKIEIRVCTNISRVLWKSCSGKKCLEALALRKRAEEETGRGDFAEAYSLLSQAIDLKPFGGLHIMYKDRSAARLAMGDINGALEDAKEAMTLNIPRGTWFSLKCKNNTEALSGLFNAYLAYICEGDVLMAMDQCDAAEQSYLIALDLDPSIRRSKSFKAKIAKLQEKLAPANLG